MKKGFLSKCGRKLSSGVRIVTALLLVANSILPGFQAFATDPTPEQTLKWYYIHDEASWNAAYNVEGGPLQKYYALNPDEDRWCNDGINPAHYGTSTDKQGGQWPSYCVHSWQGAVNATDAKYPWAAVDLPATFNGTISFQYNGGETIYPWGKHITRTQGYGMASIPDEFNHMAWKVDVNGNSTEEFNPSLLVVNIIPETLDYLDENEEWFYIWNEATWDTAYDASNPDVDLNDDSSFAKTPLHRYYDRQPDEDRWCDADGVGGNPGHYGQAIDKENNGGTWPAYCVQSWEGAINATDAKFPRIILGDNSTIPERHKGILVFKYKDAGKQINKYNEYDVSENGWRLYYARSIPAEKDGLSWTEFLLENGETSFDKSKFTVLLVTHVDDAITLEKVDESAPVEYQAKIGETYYATVAEALEAATAGQTVEIVEAGHYTLPTTISKAITIKGNVEGVIFDHSKNTSIVISTVSANVIFNNVEFNLTDASANWEHYFAQTNGATVTMTDCTINGMISTNGNMTFNDCTFENTASGQYAFYISHGNITVNGGKIIGHNGRLVNFFCYDVVNPAVTYNVIFDGTTFRNIGTAEKSALSIREVQHLTAQHNNHAESIFRYNVMINNVTEEKIIGDFPTGKKGGSKLWMVDNLIQGLDEEGKVTSHLDGATTEDWSIGTENGGEILVTVDGDVVYSTPKINCGEGYHRGDNGLCEANTYTITFVDAAGTTEMDVAYGVTPSHVIATKQADATCDEYAAGTWNTAIVPVEGNATYTAQYECTTPKTYTITWNIDGVTSEEQLGWHAQPSHEVPTKEADDEYTYTFTGWNDETMTYGVNETLPVVSGEVTYTAVFDKTPIPLVDSLLASTAENESGDSVDMSNIEIVNDVDSGSVATGDADKIILVQSSNPAVTDEGSESGLETALSGGIEDSSKVADVQGLVDLEFIKLRTDGDRIPLGSVTFDKPIKVKIKVKNSGQVRIKVKHGGGNAYGYDLLTLNPSANCNALSGDEYTGSFITATAGSYVEIYTCGASTFVAYTEEDKPASSTSTPTGGSSGGSSGGGSSNSTENNEETLDNSSDTDATESNSELVDIENQSWYDNDGNQQELLANGYSREMNNAYEFAYRAGITTMPSINEADMNGKLNRIAMAKMLSQYAINVLGKKPDTSKKPNFGDVASNLDKEYNNGVTLAYQLGIMGVGIENFRPYDLVPRSEFVTALSRMLYGLEDGTDKYYSTHMAKLKKEGIITNTDPTLEELRGYVMLMLMRSAK